MHEIAQNCVCNGQNSLAAAGWGSASRPRWGSLWCSPKPIVDWGLGKSPAQTSPPRSIPKFLDLHYKIQPVFHYLQSFTVIGRGTSENAGEKKHHG